MDRQLRNLIIIVVIMLLITPTRQVDGNLKSMAEKTVENIIE